MHGLITNIRLPKMLAKGKNCTIKSLFAYFTIPLPNPKKVNFNKCKPTKKLACSNVEITKSKSAKLKANYNLCTGYLEK